MADFQEQLQAILGDPAAMGQITAIARALTGGGQAQPSPGPEPGGQGSDAPPVQEAEYVPVETGEAAPIQGAVSAGPAPDLSGLFGLLGGGGSMPDIDPRLIQAALRLYSEYSAQDDDKAALLAALKPFLKPERREKMEKAERIARLSRVVRMAVQIFREEGTGHV